MAENTENKTLMIPFVASESSMDRLERSNHRMFIIIVLLIIGLVISNSMIPLRHSNPGYMMPRCKKSENELLLSYH